ncbi:MAG: acyl-CoA/acyl-ACP dehydrogenase [Nitrospinae bacterium]|nr:acyl-CoA/acyl-ACP dehydrogenase [Nitrospinota bacterium]
MDFELSEEQKSLQLLARKFAMEEMLPEVAELEKRPDGEDKFPYDLVKRGAALGFHSLGVPEAHGGDGASVLTQCVVVEELSVGSPSVSKVYSHNWKAIAGLIAVATPEQLARVVPDYLEDPLYCIGIAITEPDAGSDNALPFDADPAAGPALSAVRDGDSYVLNGMKQFIAMGAQAKYVTAFARTDRSVPWTKGTTGFMIFPPHDGFEVGRLHDKVGLRCYPQHDLIFRDVRVPVEDRLGEEDAFQEGRKSVVNVGTVEATATSIGIARRAYDLALGYARERVQGGKPIIEHDLIGALLLEMFTRVEAARTLLWRAAWSIDQGMNDQKLARATKVLAVETLNYMATKAVEVWGGVGVMKDAPVEKVYRDAIQLYHMGNTNQVNVLKALPHL